MSQEEHGAIFTNITDSLAALGQAKFFTSFFALVEQGLKADQCMFFRYDQDHVECLLSRNFGAPTRGEVLAQSYLAGGYLKDPLLKRVRKLKSGKSEIWSARELEKLWAPDYKRQFFSDPKLGDKVAVLVEHSGLQVGLSFYRKKGQPHFSKTKALTPALWSAVGQLYLAHYRFGRGSASLGPLAVLSERERLVCTGILRGQKIEAIAHECNISPTTAATYRKRAYQKLGIHSRAALFAICGKG